MSHGHKKEVLVEGNQTFHSVTEKIAGIVEMKNSRSNGLCCGAGGAQMFKEPEKGDKDVNVLRTEEALDTGSKIIAVACPFCNIMMSDGVKGLDKSKKTIVLDIAELVSQAEEF